MRILVLGSGGREHALCWKIQQSPEVEKVYAIPGNPGIKKMEKSSCAPLNIKDFGAIKEFIQKEKIQIVVVGPEEPLALGITDFLSQYDIPVFGPTAQSAQLEASKSFAKNIMKEAGIPTAHYAIFKDSDSAIEYVRKHGTPIVIKADGLAAGKGVTVAFDENNAINAINDAMQKKTFGSAGETIVIEQYLTGEEASILAFSDGRHIIPLTSSQDHKPVFDDDKGPNTGGMGAYSPAPIVTNHVEKQIFERILQPTIETMSQKGMPFKGILYAGLMINEQGPYVVEFNVRFGDPETQAILPRMESDIVPFFRATIEGTLDKLSIKYNPYACVTVALTSKGYPGTYEKGKLITGIDEAEKDPNVVVFHAGTAEEDGKFYTNGGRVLNVTAWDKDLPSAVKKAYNAVDKIHFEGMHYRKDIAKKGIIRLQRS
ncbi:MAG: phosphoribosylamine--glycine ligase [Candidatus Hydrogenedens sp.]|nr:phosphoribosylamine--glycine ligase [Candidatus Hydrogenedens sp.]